MTGGEMTSRGKETFERKMDRSGTRPSCHPNGASGKPGVVQCGKRSLFCLSPDGAFTQRF